MKQYDLAWNSEHGKWVLKSQHGDMWIRSGHYKWYQLRKAIKYCRTYAPSELIIHYKDGHIEETRKYH